jgi:hypothetical protein
MLIENTFWGENIYHEIEYSSRDRPQRLQKQMETLISKLRITRQIEHKSNTINILAPAVVNILLRPGSGPRA